MDASQDRVSTETSMLRVSPVWGCVLLCHGGFFNCKFMLPAPVHGFGYLGDASQANILNLQLPEPIVVKSPLSNSSRMLSFLGYRHVVDIYVSCKVLS